MGSALLNPAAALEFAEAVKTAAPTPRPGSAKTEPLAALSGNGNVDELRLQVAERLAAHRNRRGGAKAHADPSVAARPAGTRSARIAAAVAERYAQTPSYRTVLAAEAERATQQARAAAEVAALNAQAIAAAHQRLLAAYDEHAIRTEEQEAAAPESEAVAMTLWPEPEISRPPAERRVLRPARDGNFKEAERSGSTRESKIVPTQGARSVPRASSESTRDVPPQEAATPAQLAGGFTVRLYEDAARAVRVGLAGPPDTFTSAPIRQRAPFTETTAAEAIALDDEIAFRHAPVFEEPAGPPLALPANLIEFPRQLVAARKARPRLAEGPLRDEADAGPGDGQLRIFEVDPAQISTSPEAAGETHQWTSIWLDTPTDADRAPASAQVEETWHEAQERPVSGLEPASLARRGVAAAINLAIITAGVAAFSAAVVATVGHRNGVAWPTGLPIAETARQLASGLAAQTDLQAKSAGVLLALSGIVLLLVYHALFFCFSTATPGMRCVRIAFCTFEDGNPTRRAVRRRMLATLLSASPLGMGYAWAAIDEDRLTWHDRISRMYLRRY
jgi:hypothetical protein